MDFRVARGEARRDVLRIPRRRGLVEDAESGPEAERWGRGGKKAGPRGWGGGEEEERGNAPRGLSPTPLRSVARREHGGRAASAANEESLPRAGPALTN